MPSPHGPQPDEDHLDRDHGDERPEDGDDGDLAEAVIISLVRCLHDAGPAAVKLLRQLARRFDEMCEATMERDHAGLEAAACDAHETLAKLLED
jgi:hypothetical protein